MVLFPDSPAPAEKEQAEVKNTLLLAEKYKQQWLSFLSSPVLSHCIPTEILPLQL